LQRAGALVPRDIDSGARSVRARSSRDNRRGKSWLLKFSGDSREKKSTGDFAAAVSNSLSRAGRFARFFFARRPPLRLSVLKYTDGVLFSALAFLKEMANIRKRSERKDVSEPNAAGGSYFFPERLVATLARIPDYPVTFVEAPSGYGKTTAVREYLKNKNNLPAGASAHWHTCLGEPPAKAWDSICGLFRHADAEVAEALKGLYPPSAETVSDIAALIRELRCESDMFLVIDNYQLFENAAPRLLMDVFSVHASPGLRVIFISQPLPRSSKNVQNPNILRFAAKDFLFDEDSIARYCRLSGIKIPESEIGRIGKISEGWISAIRLQVDNYGATGSLLEINDIDGLIETAV
jgi:hypothetical protein